MHKRPSYMGRRRRASAAAAATSTPPPFIPPPTRLLTTSPSTQVGVYVELMMKGKTISLPGRLRWDNDNLADKRRPHPVRRRLALLNQVPHIGRCRGPFPIPRPRCHDPVGVLARHDGPPSTNAPHAKPVEQRASRLPELRAVALWVVAKDTSRRRSTEGLPLPPPREVLGCRRRRAAWRRFRRQAKQGGRHHGDGVIPRARPRRSTVAPRDGVPCYPSEAGGGGSAGFGYDDDLGGDDNVRPPPSVRTSVVATAGPDASGDAPSPFETRPAPPRRHPRKDVAPHASPDQDEGTSRLGPLMEGASDVTPEGPVEAGRQVRGRRVPLDAAQPRGADDDASISHIIK